MKMTDGYAFGANQGIEISPKPKLVIPHIVATSHVFEHISQGRPNVSFLYLYHLSHMQAVLDGSGGNRPGQVGFI